MNNRGSIFGGIMNFDISKHGDIIEQHYFKIIREKIPSYEEIWKRYIGNNGKAKIIDIPDLNPSESKNRIIFSQYHYSAFESLVCMHEIMKEIDPFK